MLLIEVVGIGASGGLLPRLPRAPANDLLCRVLIQNFGGRRRALALRLPKIDPARGCQNRMLSLRWAGLLASRLEFPKEL
jgi:hypothetical protein